MGHSATYQSTLDVVVTGERIKGAKLHPALTQIFGSVLTEAADVCSNLSGDEKYRNNKNQAQTTCSVLVPGTCLSTAL